MKKLNITDIINKINIRNIRNIKVISFIIVFAVIIIFAMLFFKTNNDENYAVAKVLSIEKIESGVFLFDFTADSYNVKLELLTGKHKGVVKEIEHYISVDRPLNNLYLDENDKITVSVFFEDNEMIIGIEEYYKTRKLLFILLLFIATIILLTGRNGFKALLSLSITLLLIFGFMTELLLRGLSPVFIAVIFSIVITFVTIIIISGRNIKSYSAIIGTIGGVCAAAIFGGISVRALQLSGYIGHESLYLHYLSQDINLQGLLLCGIIIGALGAVMDVSISIASAITEIKDANKNYNILMLFNSGMKIGKDIIGTMTNTLVLAYAGSSFTLILLFSAQKTEFPLFKIINMEFIASEIVRTVAGSFGMVLAIPVTAIVSAFLHKKYN